MRLCGLVLIASVAAGQAALFDFPTKNRALLEGRPQDFFMYVERDFEGEKTKPWEGGKFGFVRGPQRTADGVVMATVHEGVDIAPLRRTPEGIPLDDVVVAADGRVVHVSNEPGASNYGRYIVVEHEIEGSPVYTLYAHLASAAVTVGQSVRQGETLGRLGYTGEGIDRTRAHVHFEIALMLNRGYEAWHAAHFGGSPNKHGLYNGMNLAGTDPAAILLAAARDPTFRFSKHVVGLPPVFNLTIPAKPGMSLLRDYPWLVPAGEVANPPAWTISFTGTGFPIVAHASTKPVETAEVSWILAGPPSNSLATRGLIGGTPGQPRLTEAGRKFVALIEGVAE